MGNMVEGPRLHHNQSKLPLKIHQPQLKLRPKQIPSQRQHLNNSTASSSSNNDYSSDSSHKDTYSDTFSIDSIYSSDSSRPSHLPVSSDPLVLEQEEVDLDRELDGFNSLNSPASILLNYHQLLSHFPSPPPLQQQLYQQSDLVQSTASILCNDTPTNNNTRDSSLSNTLLPPRQFTSDSQKLATTPPLRIIKRPIYASKSIPALKPAADPRASHPPPPHPNRARSFSNPKSVLLAQEQPIHVILRIRNHEETSSRTDKSHYIQSLNSQTVQVKIKQPQSSITQQTKFQTHQFKFDQIIDGSAPGSNDQIKLYETSDLETKCLNPFMEGYNVSLIVYGQTGSGKSFTMGTAIPSNPSASNLEDFGLIPRTLKSLFAKLARLRDQDWSLEASFLEIYHEDLIDLCPTISDHASVLAPNSTGTTIFHKTLPSIASSLPMKLGGKSRNLNSSQSRSASPTISLSSQSTGNITIREASDGTITWVGAKSIKIQTLGQAMNVLRLGLQKRSTGSTLMNKASSRSHAIFCLRLTTVGRSGMKKASKFQFVDLAGSERVDRTKASTGSERFKEGVSINSGLHALGNVISALTRTNGASNQPSKCNGYIPYRESKLTRILQDSLGGNSKTVIIGCISPDSTNVAESLNTLRYVSRSGAIKNNLVQSSTSCAQSRENNSKGGMAVEKVELIKLLKDSKNKIESLMEENIKLRQELKSREERFAAQKMQWETKFKEIVIEYENTFEKLEYEKQELEKEVY